MSRPSTHDDLADYQRQGHLVAMIPSDHITRFPSLGQQLLAALTEADNLELTITDDGRIEIPKTTAELDKALEQAQQSWDYNQDRYRKSIDGDPDACIPALRRSLDVWAKAEGLDLVDWDALDAEAAR